MKPITVDLVAFQMEVKKLKETTACKGRFFRCIINNHLSNDGGYVEQTRMRPLKRLSCKGCQSCDHIDVGIQEQLDNDISLVIDNPINGAKYKLDIGNIGTDWESGMVDEWDYVFTLVK